MFTFDSCCVCFTASELRTEIYHSLVSVFLYFVPRKIFFMSFGGQKCCSFNARFLSRKSLPITSFALCLLFPVEEEGQT